MMQDQTLEMFKDSFDTSTTAHLIECNTSDETRGKAEQLVFIYKIQLQWHQCWYINNTKSHLSSRNIN